MSGTITELLQFVRENDVKFIRLSFCDLFGVQKNIAILASELERAFSEGILIDASAVDGFSPSEDRESESSDLFLTPDCSTVSILPWRPAHERVMRLICDVKNPDGSDFTCDTRSILKKAVQRGTEEGYFCKVGAECEFYLFLLDDLGNPSMIPFDRGSYADVAPLDRGENIRREICLALEEMGVMPESSRHERGPGQNEIDFKYSDPLSFADDLMTFRFAVKSIAAQSGLYASFLPKPFLQECGNGMHVNLSLCKGGQNLFKTSPNHSQRAESFLQGILDRAAELSVFLNPIPNSYSRLGQMGAPERVSWSHQSRSQLVRIPASKEENNRMELRSPDPACNPYLAFALLIHAGLDGVEQHSRLMPSGKENAQTLPKNLGEAIVLAEKSEFLKRVLPPRLLSAFLEQKQREWEERQKVSNPHQFDLETYFDRI